MEGQVNSEAYTTLLQSRISELEEKYPREVADTRLLTELAGLESLVFDESALCQNFDNEVIDERVPVLERIQHVRQLYVNEISATLTLDNELFLELSECKKVNSENMKVVEMLAAKKKEHHSVAQLRDKLQNLCRMIQQQTKDIVANSGEFAATEKHKTEELDAQFTTSIDQISSQLVEQEESLALQDAENVELRDKLIQFEEHIALRSQHYAAQLKAKDLELQLEEAKHSQKQHLNQQETSTNENLLSKIASVQASNEEMTSQLGLYAEKFVMFEDALSRSSSMFEQFQLKITNLDETIARMSEERDLRREICCKLDLNLFDLMDEKKRPAGGADVEEAQAAKEVLQTKCRALQQQRTELIQRKKEGIAR